MKNQHVIVSSALVMCRVLFIMAVFYDKTSTDELAKDNLIQIGENGIVSRYYKTLEI